MKVRCNRIVSSNDGYVPSNNILTERLGLTFVLFLSITLPLIPYIPSINPGFKPVSVDIRYYSMWLDNMLTTDYWSAVEYAFYGMENGNRPLYLLMLYALINFGIPRDVVLNMEAAYIAPLFAIAVYFSAKRLSDNHLYALLTSLAGILGFDMTVNVMGGFFAGWTALVLFYVCLTLAPSLRKGCLGSLLGYLAVSIAMLYIHPSVWSLLMGTLTLHLILQALRSFRGSGFEINKRLLSVLVVNAVVDFLKSSIAINYGGLVCSAARLSWHIGFNNPLRILYNLRRISTSYLGGLLCNPLHMALALIGVLSLAKRRDEESSLILTWLSIISIILPFSDYGYQSALLIVAPFPFLIAEGLWALSGFLGRFDPKLPKLLVAFFITSSLTYTVRALCNLI